MRCEVVGRRRERCHPAMRVLYRLQFWKEIGNVSQGAPSSPPKRLNCGAATKGRPFFAGECIDRGMATKRIPCGIKY